MVVYLKFLVRKPKYIRQVTNILIKYLRNQCSKTEVEINWMYPRKYSDIILITFKHQTAQQVEIFTIKAENKNLKLDNIKNAVEEAYNLK